MRRLHETVVGVLMTSLADFDADVLGGVLRRGGVLGEQLRQREHEERDQAKNPKTSNG